MFEVGDIVAVKLDDGMIDVDSIGQVNKILPSDPEYPEARTIKVIYRKQYNYNYWGTHAPKNLSKVDVKLLYQIWNTEKSFDHFTNIKIRR